MAERRRVGNHNGRKRKDGSVFGARHLDRNFNVANAPHIDAEKSCENTYWMNPSFGITASTFDDFERQFYEKYFADFIKRTNDKAIQQRHFERMIDVDSMRKNPRTCLEETLVYFGNQKFEKLPREMFDSMMQELVDYIHQTFPNCKVVDYAIHRDEQGAEHGEMRMAWIAQDKDGILIMNQTKALAQMGFENNKKRNDNAKMRFTKMIREKQIAIARSHGLEVELIPREKGKSGRDLAEYQLQEIQQKFDNLQKLVVSKERVEEIKEIARPNKLNKNEVVLHRDDFDELVQTALQCEAYGREALRLQNERGVPDDQKEEIEKLKRRVNYLERLVEALQKMQQKLLDLIERFLQKRNIDVAEFKMEYREEEMEVKRRAEQKHAMYFETHFDQDGLDDPDGLDDIIFKRT